MSKNVRKNVRKMSVFSPLKRARPATLLDAPSLLSTTLGYALGRYEAEVVLRTCVQICGKTRMCTLLLGKCT